MPTDYDFVVGGGSVAGLAFAAEASKRGASVLVLEEHETIGEPEKCDGLVSLRGLRSQGFAPHQDVIQNQINTALIHSPRGRQFAVNATALEVIVLERSSYDKQLARLAESRGAVVRTGTRVAGTELSAGEVSVSANGERITAKYYVDATGPASSPRRGIMPAAKFEVEGDWIREHVVEVFLDQDLYPGFFAWVIPYGRHRAKVGAAGFGIAPFRALDDFLATRPSRILRRISAPLYVGGPVRDFVRGRTILVGESAGQVKPTTAGGIMTSIAGAVSAAHWASESLGRGGPRLLENYRREWDSRFLKEMRNMLRLRGVFEKLTNSDLESLMEIIATPKVVLKLSQSDFDFHASALLGALGLQGVLRLARAVTSAEVRALLVSG
ncbi:MAG TPA: NAD(P)/FAD-dependent oxidoreductase [Nitrososphaerales archaeon]|nr:NAD(P)/FAD-dependent oxidoreductase [Nitrososphaerales archaeon]